MATPRTLGRLPSQRLLPALPTESSSCSELPTSPTVARQRPCTRRISVERSRRVTYSPSLATTCALDPAVPGHLAALPDLELDVVHRGAERDLAQRQRVAGPGVRARPRDDRVALAQPLGVEDVALLAIGVHDQGDAGAPVRIVLDLRDLARDPELVPLEVDLPVLPLVARRRDAATSGGPGCCGRRCAFFGSSSDFSGVRAGDLVESRRPTGTGCPPSSAGIV